MRSLTAAHQSESLAERTLLILFRRFPPKEWIFIRPEGRALMEYQDELDAPFHNWFGKPNLVEGREVLDLGCGYGGRPVRFVERGARSVVGVEINEEIIEVCRRFADERYAPVEFRVGTGEHIPAGLEFDLITMYDVFEHVISPKQTLDECWRVLKPGGQVAMVFPPYYALRGGPHLHGYATWLPGINLLFKTATLRSATRLRLEEQDVDWRPYLREVPTDKLWNMNGVTAHGFHQLVKQTGFKVVLCRHTSHFESRRQNGRLKRWQSPAYWGFRNARQCAVAA